MAETDAQRLPRKHAQAHRLGIELSEREANKEVVAKAKAVHHAKEQENLIRRFSGQAFSKDSDLTGGSTSSSNDDAPVHAVPYTGEGHNCIDARKGKGPVIHLDRIYFSKLFCPYFLL